MNLHAALARRVKLSLSMMWVLGNYDEARIYLNSELNTFAQIFLRLFLQSCLVSFGVDLL
jgi:hypothetical protein